MRPISRLLFVRVRRIDAPQDALLTLVFAGPEERGVLVFCFGGSDHGVGIVSDRPHGQPASAFVQKLRKELEGGRISELGQPDGATLRVAIQRGGDTHELWCNFAEPRIELRDASGAVLIGHAPALKPSTRTAVAWPETLEELEAIGPSLLRDRALSAVEERRLQLAKLVRTAEKRLERRLIALQDDMHRAEGAAPLRERANLLLQNLHALRRGQKSASVIDYSADPPAAVEIELDETKPPREQIEAWFKIARRYERGAELARERTATTQQEIAQLAELRAQLKDADAAALEQLAQTARTLGVRGLSSGGATSKSHEPRRHKPYRELRGYGQRAILVGKNAEDNDTLTRDHARPHDLWLHVRDHAGSHVVVPLERNETCPQELLLDAAHLAAHYSEVKNDPVVDIAYTEKRHVHKARKSPKGTVQLTKQKVIHLQVDPQRLSKLLASEIHD